MSMVILSFNFAKWWLSIQVACTSHIALQEAYALQAFKVDPQLQQLPHTVIASWYQRRGYVTAMADLIQQSLQQFQEQVCVLFCFFVMHVTLWHVGAMHLHLDLLKLSQLVPHLMLISLLLAAAICSCRDTLLLSRQVSLWKIACSYCEWMRLNVPVRDCLFIL